MLYRITEGPSTHKPTGHLHVLVDFWRSRAAFRRGEAPALMRFFQMQLQLTATLIVTDGQGRFKRRDGTFVNSPFGDPPDLEGIQRLMAMPRDAWETQTIDLDLRAQIRANIEAFWERAEVARRKGQPFPARDVFSGALDDSDPRGILARADVKSLRGATFLVRATAVT